MLENIFQTGIVSFLLVWLVRYFSDDDAAIWWKVIVVATGCISLATMVISSLIMIWSN